jgi:hypothetical protein
MTDGRGDFTFVGAVLLDDCKIQAFYKGFAPLEIPLGQRRTFVLELKLAEVVQTVDARSDPPSLSSITSVRLSADDLKKISDNSDTLLAYAKQLAGVYSGPDHIYVDGLPADQLPPADRIQSITINADPFSAEYSDGTGAHIDIITKNPDRRVHFYTGGIPSGVLARDGLDPHLKSSSNSAAFGVSGPVPSLPFAFTSDLSFTDRKRELPIIAIVPFLPASPIGSVAAAQTNDSNLLISVGAHYVGSESVHVDSSLYFATARHSNMNVSGLTLAEAGINLDTNAREFRTTLTKTGAHFVYRGGIIADWLDQDFRANSNTLGVSVSGAFVAGGAQITKAQTQAMKWTLKNVLSLDTGKRLWNFGAVLSRSANQQFIKPNPVGSIQFSNLEDYVMSATTGAHTGTALIVRGNGDIQYTSYVLAPFVESEIVRTRVGSVRGGLRADYQSRGRLLLSPRVSTSISLPSGLLMRAGAGMFVENWKDDTFISVIENDGRHLHRTLIPNASLSDLTPPSAPRSEVASAIAPSLALPREWMSKVSVERSFKSFVPGLEYTFIQGSHLLGSERLSASSGWMDLLESNRAFRKQQLHLRTQYKFGGQILTGNYEWVRSFDNTDGPFSFPAISGDLKDEWARSSGISPHNMTLAGNFQLHGGVFVNLVGSWRSSAPYNITSGLDPAHNGLHNDRGGLPRNSGRAPAYGNISFYASRRFPMPRLTKKSQHNLYANLGLQAENVLGNRNYGALDAVKSSPIFGQPLSAVPGRSFRLSLNLGQ